MATFAVILLHTACFLSLPGTPSHCAAMTYDGISRWCVPFFVMISGALFLNPERQISTRTLYRKYILHLAVVYIVWQTFYVCISRVLVPAMSEGDIVWTDALKAWVDPFIHLWFLPMLIGVYMLIPLLRKLAISRYCNMSIGIWAICFSLLFVAKAMITEVRDMNEWLYCIIALLGYAGYYLLGYRLANMVPGNKHRITATILFLLSAGLTLLFSLIHDNDSMFFDYLSPNVMLMSASLFVLTGWLLQNTRPNKLLHQIVSFTRKELLGIYLMHIIFVAMISRTPLLLTGWTAWLTIPVISIVVFVCSLFTIKLLHRLRIRYIC